MVQGGTGPVIQGGTGPVIQGGTGPVIQGGTGPVIQEPVDTGNLQLDKAINKFYNCLSHTHEDPPTIQKTDNCYYQTLGGNTGMTSSNTISSDSSGLMTQAPNPTTLTLSLDKDFRGFCTLSGTLKTDTGPAVAGATITFTGQVKPDKTTHIRETAVTNLAGDYSTTTFCKHLTSITARYAGAPAIQIPANAASDSEAIPVYLRG
jgi:hypothetical protein